MNFLKSIELKTLFRLTLANIKMAVRDKGMIFWSLFFPFIIIAIFGVLDFAKFSTSKIGFVYDESTKQYAKQIEEVLGEIGDYYKIEEGRLEEEKQALMDDNRIVVLEFTKNDETQQVDVNAYLSKANEQAAQTVFLVVQKVLADFELQLQQTQPIFAVETETVNVHELRNIDYMVPGVIAMALMQGGIFGVVGTIVNYREKGILKRLFATPLSKANFLLAQIFSRLTISVAQVIILMVTAYLVFQIKIVGSLILVAAFSIVGGLVFLSLGFIVSGIAKTSESARAIVMPIQMVMMFTSGVYFSRDVLPDWLFDITAYTPLTYLADALRDVMTRGLSLTDSVIQTAAMGLLFWLVGFVLFAVKSFKWEK